MDTIGLIAGKSDFPVLFAKAAGSKGVRIVAIGIEGETGPGVEKRFSGFAVGDERTMVCVEAANTDEMKLAAGETRFLTTVVKNLV